MNTTLKRVISILGLLSLVVFPMASSAYDKAEDLYAHDYAPSPFHDFLSSTYNDKSDSIVRIETHGHALTIIPFNSEGIGPHRAIGEFLCLGSGFIVGDYAITAAHVVHPDTAMVRISTNSLIHTGSIIRVLDRSINIRASFYDWFDGSIPAEIEHIDINNDLCILSFPNDLAPWVRPLPFSIGTGYLHEGMAIATLVRNRNEDMSPGWWTIARYGRLTNRHVIVPKEITHHLPFWGLGEATCELEIYPGDSGSPVFGFEDGKPALIGVVTKKLLIEPLHSYFTRLGILQRMVP